jgi:hypothetical protein
MKSNDSDVCIASKLLLQKNMSLPVDCTPNAEIMLYVTETIAEVYGARPRKLEQTPKRDTTKDRAVWVPHPQHQSTQNAAQTTSGSAMTTVA